MRPPSAWSTVGTPGDCGNQIDQSNFPYNIGCYQRNGGRVVDIELRVAEKPKQRRIGGVGRKRKHTPNVKKQKVTI